MVTESALTPEAPYRTQEVFERSAWEATRQAFEGPAAEVRPLTKEVIIAFSVSPHPSGVPPDEVAAYLRQTLTPLITVAAFAEGQTVNTRAEVHSMDGRHPRFHIRIEVTFHPVHRVQVSPSPPNTDANGFLDAAGEPYVVARAYVRLSEEVVGDDRRVRLLDQGPTDAKWAEGALHEIHQTVTACWHNDYLTHLMQLTDEPLRSHGTVLVEIGLQRLSPFSYDGLGFDVLLAYEERFAEMAAGLLDPAAAAPGRPHLAEDAAWGCWVRVTCEQHEAPAAPAPDRGSEG